MIKKRRDNGFDVHHAPTADFAISATVFALQAIAVTRAQSGMQLILTGDLNDIDD